MLIDKSGHADTGWTCERRAKSHSSGKGHALRNILYESECFDGSRRSLSRY